jgi:hypothetical protein
MNDNTVIRYYKNSSGVFVPLSSSHYTGSRATQERILQQPVYEQPVQQQPVYEQPQDDSRIVKPYLNPQNGCEVVQGLYLGNAEFASDLDLLKGLGVTHIVNSAKEVPDYFKGDFNFQYLHLMLNDIPEENISRFFEVSRNFIAEALDNGGVVLVHCWAGVSRSVTVVIYYLTKTYGISVKEALKIIRERRPIANPNVGFIKQLGNVV